MGIIGCVVPGDYGHCIKHTDIDSASDSSFRSRGHIVADEGNVSQDPIAGIAYRAAVGQAEGRADGPAHNREGC